MSAQDPLKLPAEGKRRQARQGRRPGGRAGAAPAPRQPGRL